MLHKELPAGYKARTVKFGPYSPSRLIVAKCPQRFYSQYVRKDKAVGYSLASARGSAIHQVLAKITYALINQVNITPKLVDGWVAESVGMFPASYEQVDLIKGAATAYIARPNPYLNSTTSCETAFGVVFAEEESFLDDVVLQRGYVATPYRDADGNVNKEIFFGGTLDQITVDETVKIVTILDHKSTPSANQNADNNFQVGCYAWLVSLFYPGYQIRTVIHYAHPDLHFYAPPVYWSHEELQEMESYIHSRIWSIENFNEFPAIPNNGCEYCHIVQECEENLAVMAQQARGPIDLNVRHFSDLQRLAKQIRPLGVLYDQLNAALKKGVETFAPVGGVALEGIWYGFKPTEEAVDWIATDIKVREESNKAKYLIESGEADPQQKALLERRAAAPDLTTLLSKHGVKPDSFKEWQAAKFKALYKLDKPELLDQLREYIVTKKSTRFGGHKS